MTICRSQSASDGRSPPRSGAVAGTLGRGRGAAIASCAAVSNPPSETISARSIAFDSSRMLPGQACASSASRASRLSRGLALAHAGADRAHEVVGEEQDVVAALAQRRQVRW